MKVGMGRMGWPTACALLFCVAPNAFASQQQQSSGQQQQQQSSGQQQQQQSSALSQHSLEPGRDVGWGVQFPDEPDLITFDTGLAVSSSKFERYQARRLEHLADFLRSVQAKLSNQTLTVGGCHFGRIHRLKAVEHVEAAFRQLGCEIDHPKRGDCGTIEAILRPDIFIAYSYRPDLYQQRLQLGKHTIVVEEPYWRRQWGARLKKHGAINWDGVNNRGLGMFDPALARYEQVIQPHVNMQPMRTGCQGVVLVLGQLTKDTTQIPVRRRFGTPDRWAQHAVDQLKQRLKLPIWWKTHPEEMRLKQGKYFVPTGAEDKSDQDLGDLLQHTYLAVTASSGAALTAMTAGVPVLAMEVGFAAWRCALHDFDSVLDIPIYDRKPCFDKIAQAQWTYAHWRSPEFLRKFLNPNLYDPATQLGPVAVQTVRRCSSQVGHPAKLQSVVGSG